MHKLPCRAVMNPDTDKSELERLFQKLSENSKAPRINPLDVGLLMKHIEEIEPFYHVRELYLMTLQEHPSLKDLRFLMMFPNIRTLDIYIVNHCREAEKEPMSFDGIQNCLNLERVFFECCVLPPILTGIEFCTNLVNFIVKITYDSDRSLDITLLLELPRLKNIYLCCTIPHKGVRVETENLDLTGCKSLQKLAIHPMSKDLRFLGSVQLRALSAPRSGIESLEGLDTTRLARLDLRQNRITCIEKLRGAKLRDEHNCYCLDDNPVDPGVLEEVRASWV